MPSKLCKTTNRQDNFQLLCIFVVNFNLLRRSEKAMQFLFDRIIRPVVASCAANGRTEAITQVP